MVGLERPTIGITIWFTRQESGCIRGDTGRPKRTSRTPFACKNKRKREVANDGTKNKQERGRV